MSKRIVDRICRIVLVSLMAACNVGCHRTAIPSSASVAAEDENVVVFLHREDTNEIPQVSLWVRHKETREEKRLLVSHPHAHREWQTYERSVRIPVDSIATISRVTIISYRDEPLKFLVEGCPDYRNMESFIVTENSSDAVCLPTTNGLIGVTQEESLLIMESYDYYEGGGRYSRVEAYDREGNLVSSMEPKLSIGQLSINK